ncbi:MAG: sugar transferase, partial [Clostridia bacterium]|nr:sugar transferase [Clostridia bacterium]
MLDLMYIESFSIWMDIKLLFRTMTVFFKRDSTEGFDTKNIQDDTKKPPLGA